jgi:hypothetical protein
MPINNLEQVSLYRCWPSDKSNVGIVKVKNMVPLFSLELPWRNNSRNISCIPTGSYICERRSFFISEVWQTAFEVKEVPDRSGIIFGHIGNSPLDIKGCMAFGLYYSRENFISRSSQAIDVWMNRMIDVSRFRLTIFGKITEVIA